ncbi:hypothetical protein [Mycoplasma sp. OR1901]|uniref:hypothetical protein n=1 Tax=Mycoplasma sp. OR1901 TaxID=2742195 RepID=UPI0015830651|nr:hypothetical protein [Mycoplasma sp. OR1901]QKT05397.1 hypothetical protein HTZ87_01630 [Mycoplasma sp. OR1901]
MKFNKKLFLSLGSIGVPLLVLSCSQTKNNNYEKAEPKENVSNIESNNVTTEENSTQKEQNTEKETDNESQNSKNTNTDDQDQTINNKPQTREEDTTNDKAIDNSSTSENSDTKNEVEETNNTPQTQNQNTTTDNVPQEEKSEIRKKFEAYKAQTDKIEIPNTDYDAIEFELPSTFVLNIKPLPEGLSLGQEGYTYIRDLPKLIIKYNVEFMENEKKIIEPIEVVFNLNVTPATDLQNKAIEMVKNIEKYIKLKKDHYETLQEITPEEVQQLNIPEGIKISKISVDHITDYDSILIGFDFSVEGKEYEYSYVVKRPNKNEEPISN